MGIDPEVLEEDIGDGFLVVGEFAIFSIPCRSEKACSAGDFVLRFGAVFVLEALNGVGLFDTVGECDTYAARFDGEIVELDEVGVCLWVLDRVGDGLVCDGLAGDFDPEVRIGNACEVTLDGCDGELNADDAFAVGWWRDVEGEAAAVAYPFGFDEDALASDDLAAWFDVGALFFPGVEGFTGVFDGAEVGGEDLA